MFNKKDKTGEIAKDRLKLVLIHDRINCTPDLLEMMRIDILAVISKYVNIDTADLTIRISDEDYEQYGKIKKTPTLSANIPIKGLKNIK